MKDILSKFNLGDSYEIQARVLPAMLIVLPIAVLVSQIEWGNQDYLGMVGWGAGLEVVLAIMVSKIGHALGVGLQEKLEKIWGGLPTHAWLRPSDTSHSEQQKTQWRGAVSKLSGLNIEEAVKAGNEAEIDRVIADAILSCRNKIRGKRESELLQKQNVAFGFARNLAGLRYIALIICFSCFFTSLYGTVHQKFPIEGTIIQALFLTVASLYTWLALNYVRHCAVRYAEFFYGAITEIMKGVGAREDKDGI